VLGFQQRKTYAPEFEECIQQTLAFQDTEDLVASDRLDLSDTVRIAKGDADLRGSHTLTGKLDNLLGHFFRSGLWWIPASLSPPRTSSRRTHLEPSCRLAAVRESRAGDTLVGVVDPSHVAGGRGERARGTDGRSSVDTNKVGVQNSSSRLHGR
jgi:hypothetical protein